MEDRDWLIIKLLYERKSITKTAQALFMTQPTLTTRIRQIEEDLGVKIMYRNNKGVKFTLEGEYLAECAHNMLTAAREIRDKVTNMGNEVKGTLRIGASIYVTRYILPRLLRRFQDLYPRAEFRVITTSSQDIFSLMHTQDTHVGFVRGDYGWRDEQYLLFEEPMCIASKHPLVLSDLPRLPRIDYHTDHLNKLSLDTWWTEKFTVPPHISMLVNQVDICKDMVLNGLGYAILPSMMLTDVQHIYKTYITDKQGRPLIRRTLMLYQKEALETQLVHAFVEFVKTIDFNNPN